MMQNEKLIYTVSRTGQGVSGAIAPRWPERLITR